MLLWTVKIHDVSVHFHTFCNRSKGNWGFMISATLVKIFGSSRSDGHSFTDVFIGGYGMKNSSNL